MFRRLSKALGSKGRLKVRFDVQITSASGLPGSVASARVLWARGGKVQMTKLAQVVDGKATWAEELSIIATLDKDPHEKMQSKTYDFCIQSPDRQQRFVTLGKCSIDMAKMFDVRTQSLTLRIRCQHQGQQAEVNLAIGVTGTLVKGLYGDGDASIINSISEMSDSNGLEQDLEGFEVTHRRRSSTLQIPTLAPSAQLDIADQNPKASCEAMDSDQMGSTAQLTAFAPGPVKGPPCEESAHMGAGQPVSGEISDTASDPKIRKPTVNEGSSQTGEQALDVRNSSPPELGGAVSLKKGLDESEDYDKYAEADIAELQARLLTAEADAAEAEAVAEEAVGMLESERAERRAAEALVAQLQRDIDWAHKKAVKERVEWEARMKDAFKKMESTVLLVERVQKEKTELGERLTAVVEEKQKLQRLVDEKSVQDAIQAEVAGALTKARAQFEAEMEPLRSRINEMEEFVEDSEAKVLRADSTIVSLRAQLAVAQASSPVSLGGKSLSNAPASSEFTHTTPTRTSSGFGLGEDGATGGIQAQVREAEDRADSLSLELQYAKAECRAALAQAAAAKEDSQTAVAAAQREAESHAARAAELTKQLEASRAAEAATATSASQLRQRIVLLEDAVGRSNLLVAELQQRIAAGAVNGSSSVKSNATSQKESDLGVTMHQIHEMQDAAETRAALLAATTRDLVAAQESNASLQAQLSSVQTGLENAQRTLHLRDDEIDVLRKRLDLRDNEIAELKKLQHELASVSLNNAGNKPGAPILATAVAGMHEASASASRDDKPGGHLSSDLERRAGEAQELARSATARAATLVEQLAASQGERLEALAKVSDMRVELARLRSGAEGDLRSRIESLERELQVSRNRAEVNSLFREEHDRLAGELVAAKMGLAEAQEQMLVLKRALVKSQEKSMSFASKLTRLETKLYRRLTNQMTTMGQRRQRTTSTDNEGG